MLRINSLSNSYAKIPIKVSTLRPSIVTITMILVFSYSIIGQNVWTGAINQNWHEPNNWTNKVVPTFSTNVLIDAGFTVFVQPNQLNRAKAIRNFGTITIERGATLFINNSNFDGIECYGEITSNGTIHIRKSNSSGVIIKDGGALINSKDAILNIDTSGIHAIINDGTIVNHGAINIDSAGQIGIQQSEEGTFVNDTDITMSNLGEQGIYNNGDISNTGNVDINHTQLDGIHNRGKFTNNGNTIIDSSGTISFSNIDTLINMSGALIQMSNGNEGIVTDYIENLGEINIEDMDSTGFFHTEEFDNYGSIIVKNVNHAAIKMNGDSADKYYFNNKSSGIVSLSFTTGDAFNLNKHSLTNEGDIEIDSATISGIVSGSNSIGRLINSGEIIISRVRERAIDGIDTIFNNSSGHIYLSDISSITGALLSANYLSNQGKISATDILCSSILAPNELVNADTILINHVITDRIISSRVTNEVSGYISISESTGDGFEAITPSVNYGNIYIAEITDGVGISAFEFVNDGKIDIKNTADYGIKSTSFTNNDTILIIGRYGIEEKGDFINEYTGYIQSDSATLYVTQGGNSIINKGVIRTGGRISSWNDIINEACGKIYTTGELSGFSATYINHGYIHQNYPDVNLGITFTNYGIYQDIQNSSSAYGIVNEGITIDSIMGGFTCTDNITPIISGPNNSLISVVDITIDSLGVSSAGILDLGTNTFSPNNTVANLSKVYIQFLMPTGCVISVPLYFDSPISCEGCPINTWTGGANTSDWFTPSNWSLNMVPTSTHDVRIPDGSLIEIAVGQIGFSKLLEVSNNAELTIDGELEVSGF